MSTAWVEECKKSFLPLKLNSDPQNLITELASSKPSLAYFLDSWFVREKKKKIAQLSGLRTKVY